MNHTAGGFQFFTGRWNAARNPVENINGCIFCRRYHLKDSSGYATGSSVGIFRISVSSDRYPRIDLSTLASEPFILHFPEQTTGKLVLEALDRAGVQPRVPVRSRNTETCVKLCMQGIGMCFTPETYLQNMDFSRKPACFSVGEKGIFTTLSIAFRRGTYLPKYARDFIEIARNK
ncbi:MAG: LysR family transcriptional regulator substrate-binding protein [Lachnospiraceae bacterium]